MNTPPSLPPQSVESIRTKGFYVMPYVTTKELGKTVQFDYLNFLKKGNIFFLGICVAAGFMGGPAAVLGTLGIGYAIITAVLLVRFIERSYYYLHMNNVIFTKTHFISGKKVSSLDDPALDEYFDDAEEVFLKDEIFPTNPLSDLFGQFKHLKKLRDIDLRGNMGKAGVVLLLIVLAYAFSVLVFYFVGTFLIFLFFYPFSVLLKMYIKLREKKETILKLSSEEIEEELKLIEEDQKKFEAEVERFRAGNIFDLDKVTKKRLEAFYSRIQKVHTMKTKLANFVQSKFDQNIIDFGVFENFIMEKIKAPMSTMLELITEMKIKTQNQIMEIQNEISVSRDSNLTVRLQQKELHNQQLLIYLQDQEAKLKGM